MKQTPAYDQYNDTLLDIIPPGLDRITEVGCMRGTLAQAYLTRNPYCLWTGIDIDPENVSHAERYCHRVYCRDIEVMDITELLQWSADAWIFGDTLEHLRDPWEILSKLRRIMNGGNCILASIPNAQHWSFQARLNVGLFHYENDGLFDRTHLRFFTRTTIVELFESTGFRIDSAVSRQFNFPGYEKYIPHLRAMAMASGYDPDVAEEDSMAYQYVVKAVPA